MLGCPVINCRRLSNLLKLLAVRSNELEGRSFTKTYSEVNELSVWVFIVFGC